MEKQNTKKKAGNATKTPKTTASTAKRINITGEVGEVWKTGLNGVSVLAKGTGRAEVYRTAPGKWGVVVEIPGMKVLGGQDYESEGVAKQKALNHLLRLLAKR